MMREFRITAQHSEFHGARIKWATRAAWICVSCGFVLAVPAVWKIFHEQGDRFSLANYSSIGSYLQGSTASLWALGGLLFIYATFLGQQQQIAQQDKEMEAQKEQNRKQYESIERQNFESSFFQLLSLYNQTISSMRLQERKWLNGEMVEQYTREGRMCFGKWFRELEDEYKRAIHTLQKQTAIDTTKVTALTEASKNVDLEQVYSDFEKDHQSFLAHYFRTLFHLIKFVKMSAIVVEYQDKRRYTSLVRAQLSKYELALLFYNGLTECGANFKPWIEEFGLLEHFDKTLLFDPSHEKFYAASAYR